MELSKEVNVLLERIKKLSQQAHKNENISNSDYHIPLNLSQYCTSSSIPDEVTFTSDDLIMVDNMDFSDDERWLYVSESSMYNPFTGNLHKWLHQDFVKQDNTLEDDINDLQSLSLKCDARKLIDTRTFTRPKKRISRPSLEQLTEGCNTSSTTTSYESALTHSKTSISSLLEDEVLDLTGNLNSISVQFNLSEPVSTSMFDKRCFDKIIATAENESVDSFQNMSPPSLVNSLCSSTFTTLIDSSYSNQDSVPNDLNDTITLSRSTTNNDSKILTEVTNFSLVTNDYKSNTSGKMMKQSLNETYDIMATGDDIKISSPLNYNLNKTYDLSTSNNTSPQQQQQQQHQQQPQQQPQHQNRLMCNLSGTKTIVKKPKISNLTHSFKASCPDINKSIDLDLTFNKFSDSQPNLTEDLKRTIINQNLELMSTAENDIYHSARSGSADSLDERSSSISNGSSKDSSTRILNMSDLDNLAKVQEYRLQQAMSTPKQYQNLKSHFTTFETTTISPIRNNEYLSDSDDLSDSCVTARTSFSTKINSSRSLENDYDDQLQPLRNNHTNNDRDSAENFNHLPNKLKMVVKPKDQNRTNNQRSYSAQLPISRTSTTTTARQSSINPRMSGLPRPKTAVASTGIPRPTLSRIPGPKSIRPPAGRPNQRQPSKVDWMDGCY